MLANPLEIANPIRVRWQTVCRNSAWIAARIAAHAITTPDRLAIVDETGSLTWAELVAKSDRLADRLREVGAAPDRCVGLYLDRSADFVVAALAVLKTGAAYLPLDASTPTGRVNIILADAQANVLVSHRGKAQQLSSGGPVVLQVEDGVSEANPRSAASVDSIGPVAEGLAYIVYTSGSTGRPKGVEITHANLQNLIEWHQSEFAITSADRASQVAGLGFDAAAWEIWPHLTAGASLHIADERTRRSPQLLREWLEAQRITISFVPTVLAEQLLNMSWSKDTALRRLLTGADTLHRRPASGLPFELVNNYGPTECTVVATSGIVRSDETASGPPSIGRPIANTTAFILDDSLRPVPPGEAGELCLAGALVGRGYRNNPEMTASRFVIYSPPAGAPVRIYRTGDRARLLESGEIAFLGRVDNQVKIRGYRIELGEIVASLDRFLGVEASAVIARDDAGAGPQLVAYVVSAPGAKVSSVDLRDFLAARLPDYMIPAIFVGIDALPVTANGKLDKSALPIPTAENLMPGEQTAAKDPAGANGIEQRIAALVTSLLGHVSVGREENFFMAGGHSMLGVQLVARIRDTFGVKLNLRQLFGAPTIAALSLEVEKLSAAKTA